MVLNDQFLQFLTENSSANRRINLKEDTFGPLQSDKDSVHDLTIENKNVANVYLQNIKFENVKFINNEFLRFTFSDCIFVNCNFINCRFHDVLIDASIVDHTTWEESALNDIRIEFSQLYNISINRCKEIYEFSLYSCTIGEVEFKTSIISTSQFSKFTKVGNVQLMFVDCEIDSSQYLNVDFITSYFERCLVIDCFFVNSSLSNETFILCDGSIDPYINKIDLQTILKSSITEKDVLNLFGISNSDIKDYIKELTTEVFFQSVFISYSFKDSAFATQLNHKLRSKGINTFLWQQDAPGGKRLKKIMQENIHKHDRLLFVASQHSLKSQACQFELTEGRIKQDKEWSDIFFPIHIDNYLFELDKDDIPREYRDEYWKNVEEIKDFNSLDFSSFRDDCIDNSAFDIALDSLIRDLRK